jgi:hypothetical protein
MPRDGSNVYHLPSGTLAVTNTTVQSTPYNNFTGDIEADLNTPRPIVAGGTGASSASAALTALGGENATQVIVNYASDPFVGGSFHSASSATGGPVAGHAFSGICYATDSSNMFIEARDQDDSVQPGNVYVRQKKAGVWSAWQSAAGQYVDTAGDTMTGLLILSGDPAAALGAATKQYVDNTTVSLAGDTMTGLLTLSADPSTNLQAATKHYVDTAITTAIAGLPPGTIYVPSGSVMPFYQAAAPTGWTKITTLNDKALRVVSGSGGVTGGTNAFSTVMAQSVVGNHTLSGAEIPPHAHGGTWIYPGGAGIATGSGVIITAANTDNGIGLGGGAHNHSITMDIQYCDLILASKN